MNLSRKSTKKTSKISLLVALVMLSSVFATLHYQGYPVEQLGVESAQVCKAGLVEIFGSLLWY